nr:hypothetical protein [Serratia marcescens]
MDAVTSARRCTVQLELCQKPNGRNRAEVVKLLVHSALAETRSQALMKSLARGTANSSAGYCTGYAGRFAAEALYRSLVIAVWASYRIMRQGRWALPSNRYLLQTPVRREPTFAAIAS